MQEYRSTLVGLGFGRGLSITRRVWGLGGSGGFRGRGSTGVKVGGLRWKGFGRVCFCVLLLGGGVGAGRGRIVSEVDGTGVGLGESFCFRSGVWVRLGFGFA